jgi:hypothetical protein
LLPFLDYIDFSRPPSIPQRSALTRFQRTFALQWCGSGNLHDFGDVAKFLVPQKNLPNSHVNAAIRPLHRGAVHLIVRKELAWILLSWLAEFGRIQLQLPATAGHPDSSEPIRNYHLLILGDSHGIDGRRRLEDGERKRSQIR